MTADDRGTETTDATVEEPTDATVEEPTDATVEEPTDATVEEPTDATVEEAMLAEARVHARAVELPVDLDRVEWETSTRARRRAGACRWDADRGVATIVLSRRAYERYDPAAFAAVVRHELVHAWEFQRFGESGHGPRFRERAAAIDAPRHCEPFARPRYELACREDGCEWRAERHRASKPVRAPDRYRCGDCGGPIAVEHVESGRTWTTAGGYGGAKAALGDRW